MTTEYQAAKQDKAKIAKVMMTAIPNRPLIGEPSALHGITMRIRIVVGLLGPL